LGLLSPSDTSAWSDAFLTYDQHRRDPFTTSSFRDRRSGSRYPQDRRRG